MNDYGDQRDDYRHDFRDDDGERENQWFEEAQKRVQTPGTILVVFGLISVFLAVVTLALIAASPDTMYRPIYDWVANMQKQQPQNPQQLPAYEDRRKQQMIQSVAGNSISLICSIFIVLGGSKMKQLRSYGLAITGSVLGMIPCTNSCCCLSVPFGIWALVVLLNSDVKLAFAKVRAGGAM